MGSNATLAAACADAPCMNSACAVVVRKISAHPHHEYLTTKNNMTNVLVTTVELRGLEPLPL